MSDLNRELEATEQSAFVELYELDMKPLVRGLAYRDGRAYDPIRFDGDTGDQIVTPGVTPARVEYQASESQYGFFDPAGSTRLNAMRKIRFCNQRNQLGNDVVFAGKSYPAYPIKVEGFAASGTGTLPRPTMTLANVTGVLTALAGSYDDLVGSYLRRVRTFEKYLDAVNFAAGNPLADANTKLPDDLWVVDRKISEDRMTVKFELCSAMDLMGARLPARKINATSCTFGYRDAEGCPYAKMPDEADFVPYGSDDLPVPGWEQMALGERFRRDVCGKRLNSCILRFGTGAVLPFGGFPGATIYSR